MDAPPRDSLCRTFRPSSPWCPAPLAGTLLGPTRPARLAASQPACLVSQIVHPGHPPSPFVFSPAQVWSHPALSAPPTPGSPLLLSTGARAQLVGIEPVLPPSHGNATSPASGPAACHRPHPAPPPLAPPSPADLRGARRRCLPVIRSLVPRQPSLHLAPGRVRVSLPCS